MEFRSSGSTKNSSSFDSVTIPQIPNTTLMFGQPIFWVMLSDGPFQCSVLCVEHGRSLVNVYCEHPFG